MIYCHNQDVAKFYELFQSMLGPSFTDPPDFLNLSKYRLVDMYTSVTAKSVKEQNCEVILQSTWKVCIWHAFGMGLDCPNVCQIIHWGPSEELEGYVQQTGRGGWNGQLCLASLFGRVHDQHTAKQMMEYCGNHRSRRRELLKD